jgi:very-short-patch-repair endonuclease
VLPPADVVRRADGIRLTTPLRTACDLAAVLGEEDLASVIEQVLDDFRVRYVTLRRAADRLLRRGWSAGPLLRAVLDGRPAGAAAHDSHLEVRFSRALVLSGLPEPVRQLPIALLPSVDAHADLGFPGAHLVVEIDHRSWHSGSQAALDKRRDRLVRLAGYETVRVTDDDLAHRFDATVAEVVAIHRLVCRRLGWPEHDDRSHPVGDRRVATDRRSTTPGRAAH